MVTHLFSQHEQIVDDMFRLARELGSQDRVLRGDAHGARVEVALAHHGAAEGDQRGRAEAELVGAEQSGHHYVEACSDLTVGLDYHSGNKRIVIMWVVWRSN